MAQEGTGRKHTYRPYDREYAKYDNAKQRARMKARYWAIKKYGEGAEYKGMDLDHIKPLAAGGSNDPSNWRPRSVHDNRADKSFLHDPGYVPIHIKRQADGTYRKVD
jgi:hypothetical protein